MIVIGVGELRKPPRIAAIETHRRRREKEVFSKRNLLHYSDPLTMFAGTSDVGGPDLTVDSAEEG